MNTRKHPSSGRCPNIWNRLIDIRPRPHPSPPHPPLPTPAVQDHQPDPPRRQHPAPRPPHRHFHRWRLVVGRVAVQRGGGPRPRGNQPVAAVGRADRRRQGADAVVDHPQELPAHRRDEGAGAAHHVEGRPARPDLARQEDDDQDAGQLPDPGLLGIRAGRAGGEPLRRHVRAHHLRGRPDPRPQEAGRDIPKGAPPTHSPTPPRAPRLAAPGHRGRPTHDPPPSLTSRWRMWTRRVSSP